MDQARLDEIEAILAAGGPWFKAGGRYNTHIIRADDGSFEIPFFTLNDNPARQVDGPGIIRELVKRVRELEGGEEPGPAEDPDLMTVQCPRCAGTGVFRAPGLRAPCTNCDGSGKVAKERT